MRLLAVDEARRVAEALRHAAPGQGPETALAAALESCASSGMGVLVKVPSLDEMRTAQALMAVDELIAGGMTQRAVAENVGLTSAAISAWRVGKRVPTPENVQALQALHARHG